jgi:uncharacterized membrane protein
MISLEHVHPMLVHFPIVFVLMAAFIDLLVLVRGGDLTARQALPRLSLGLLVAAALSAVVTAIFGDIALDTAVSRGIPDATLETHEGLGWTTLAVVGVYALLRLAAWLRQVPLRGGRGAVGLVLSAGCAGLVLVTAYFGGELVHVLGVNVAALAS